MDNRRQLAALLAAALLVGCAATPEQTEQARTAEEQVAAILSEPLDPAE